MIYQLGEIYKEAKLQLTNHSKEEAEQLVFMVLNEVLNISRTTIIAFPDTKVSISDYNQIQNIVNRLKNNEPIQYIFEYTEFFGLKFHVSPSVLIPRPETEELVAWILSEYPSACNVLDIGTGSGCIAISLANNLECSKIQAVDVSSKALVVAEKNAQSNHVNVAFNQLDILQAKSPDFSTSYDVIVSNPPYVTYTQKELMHKNVLDYEPHLALFVENNDPLIFYRKIAELAIDLLKTNGALYYEINEEYGDEMKKMLSMVGFSKFELRKDIFNKYRMLKAMK